MKRTTMKSRLLDLSAVSAENISIEGGIVNKGTIIGVDCTAGHHDGDNSGRCDICNILL